MVEVGLGLLAACLPTLRSLFKDLPSSAMDSLKGFFTLRSFYSRQSTGPRDYSTDRIHDLRQGQSISLQSRIFRTGKEELCDVEAHPMHEFDESPRISGPSRKTSI